MSLSSWREATSSVLSLPAPFTNKETDAGRKHTGPHRGLGSHPMAFGLVECLSCPRCWQPSSASWSPQVGSSEMVHAVPGLPVLLGRGGALGLFGEVGGRKRQRRVEEGRTDVSSKTGGCSSERGQSSRKGGAEGCTAHPHILLPSTHLPRLPWLTAEPRDLTRTTSSRGSGGWWWTEHQWGVGMGQPWDLLSSALGTHRCL